MLAIYLTGRGKDYDYKPPPRFYEYTFSAGDTCATPDRPIPIVDDKDSDENERFEIHVVDDSIPYGVKIRGRDYVTVTIKDNDSKYFVRDIFNYDTKPTMPVLLNGLNLLSVKAFMHVWKNV